MNIWHDIDPSSVTPQKFMAVVEIPSGSKKKYELDKETGFLMLDRILYTSTHYPANYGFIPRTYGDDGDPLDVVVICSEKIDPMTLVRCYPIGVITMKDSGKLDEKIISIPFNDPNYNGYKDISELPKLIFFLAAFCYFNNSHKIFGINSFRADIMPYITHFLPPKNFCLRRRGFFRLTNGEHLNRRRNFRRPDDGYYCCYAEFLLLQHFC